MGERSRRWPTWLSRRRAIGAPRPELIPILALLHHDLTDDEIYDVATRLTILADRTGARISDQQIADTIEDVVGIPADDKDIAAVRAVLDRTARPTTSNG